MCANGPHPREPAYLALQQQGELAQRALQALEHLSCCDLCGWNCRKDRNSGLGVCLTGMQARVSSFGPHHGEERPLSGWNGSGTIFFSRCNLRCVYCQNFEISQSLAGSLVDAQELAAMMLALQATGCHNINLVSPTHVVPQILTGLALAASAGLRLPLVYNTGGYDSLQALALLDGVVDIYMPDMKYSRATLAKQYSRIRDYPQINQSAVREMHRQVGDLVLDESGIAERGLLVRHLVLPGGIAGTEQIVRFLADEISTDTYLNLMDQYRPSYLAHQFPQLNRRLRPGEYHKAVEAAHAAGLHRLD